MREQNSAELERELARIRSQAATGRFRLTQHAQQDMVEEEINLDEVLQAIGCAEILEYYPEHRRGACSLLSGATDDRRPLHVVCTVAQALLVLITVYEPRPPKWATARERSGKP